METSWLDGSEWIAVLRIGIGLWWIESFRHKDKRAWIERGAGIRWAASVAEKHKWGFVRRSFGPVARHERPMTFLVLGAELGIGAGLVLGLLTPIAAIGSLLLNVAYFVLMIQDWAEQGQNSMMALIAVVVLGAHGWQAWSLDAALGLF